VPGGSDGPSGVLVCSENFITWRHQGQPEVRVGIPRRDNPLDDPERGLLIVSYAMHKTKVRAGRARPGAALCLATLMSALAPMGAG